MHPDISLLDDGTRPVAEPVGPLTPAQHAAGNHLVQVHDMYRRQLEAVVEVREMVKAGREDTAALHERISAMTLRSDLEQFGAFCAQYCHLVSVHHAIEDQHLFPALRASDSGLAAVLDRLRAEHTVIHEILVRLDAAATTMVRDTMVTAASGSDDEDHDPVDPLDEVDRLVDLLAEVLLSHLRYEEGQLVEPLGYYQIMV